MEVADWKAVGGKVVDGVDLYVQSVNGYHMLQWGTNVPIYNRSNTKKKRAITPESKINSKV